METTSNFNASTSISGAPVGIKIKYCLYARKSSESEERQVMSIDSQIKEMLATAERDGMNIVEIKRESHSAKDTGQRPVFNELIADLRQERFNGIITWAPDRLSRNAGDLGSIVDLMDQKKLIEIRTHSQTFTNNPNEKFLLMILGSQAKLENDNRGINVRRGMKSRVEMGLWPGMAPFGYMNQNLVDKRCQIIPDPHSAPIVKQIFEKMAYERWSGRKIYKWLRYELEFKTRGNKPVALSRIHTLLKNSFYYGEFEYPKKSGNWYKGKHQPLITKELFERVQTNLKSLESLHKGKIKEFAFTRLMICGLCGSGITAQEKFKNLADGSVARYVYYGCTRFVNMECKNVYVREEELVQQLLKIIDRVEINKLDAQGKLQEEINRSNNLRANVLGKNTEDIDIKNINVRAYAKYLLENGTVSEKRELLEMLRSRIIYQNKKITLVD